MSRSDDIHMAQESVLRAYDELTIALAYLDLQTLKTVRRHVLDVYWLINELRLQDNPTPPADPPLPDPPF